MQANNTLCLIHIGVMAIIQLQNYNDIRLIYIQELSLEPIKVYSVKNGVLHYTPWALCHPSY